LSGAFAAHPARMHRANRETRQTRALFLIGL